jgi:hypothetical protein
MREEEEENIGRREATGGRRRGTREGLANYSHIPLASVDKQSYRLAFLFLV